MNKKSALVGLALIIVFWAGLTAIGVQLHEGMAGAVIAILLVGFLTRKKQ